jgi:hypothetical protein
MGSHHAVDDLAGANPGIETRLCANHRAGLPLAALTGSLTTHVILALHSEDISLYPHCLAVLYL